MHRLQEIFRSLLNGWREFWALSWWAKGPLLAVTGVLLVVAVSVAATGGSGGVDVEKAVSEAVRQTPTSEPTVVTTVLPGLPLPPPSPEVQVTVVTREVAVAPSPTVIVREPEPPPPPPGPSTTFGDGVYAVGADIQPGTYRAPGDPDGCYWARLSGFGGSLDEIIENDISQGPAVVTISSSDVGFESSFCGTWSKVD